MRDRSIGQESVILSHPQLGYQFGTQSWEAAAGPPRLISTRWIPASRIRSATLAVASVLLVTKTTTGLAIRCYASQLKSIHPKKRLSPAEHQVEKGKGRQFLADPDTLFKLTLWSEKRSTMNCVNRVVWQVDCFGFNEFGTR